MRPNHEILNFDKIKCYFVVAQKHYKKLAIVTYIKSDHVFVEQNMSEN